MIKNKVLCVFFYLAAIVLNKRVKLYVIEYTTKFRKMKAEKIYLGCLFEEGSVYDIIREYEIKKNHAILYFFSITYRNRFSSHYREINYYSGKGEHLFTDDMFDIKQKPFFGRSTNKAKYKAGEKVLFYMEGNIVKGKIFKTPPDVKKVAKINKYRKDIGFDKDTFEETVKACNGSLLDSSDDTYLIIFARNNHAHVHEHDIIEKIR